MPETTDTRLLIRPRLSMPTDRAVKKLKDGKPGDLLTREQMAAVIEVPIPKDIKPYQWTGNRYVHNATQIVERDHNVCWTWVIDLQAWQCQADDGMVKVTGKRVRKCRKIARRALHLASIVNESALSPDDRRRHQLNVAQAGLLTLATDGSTKKQLTAAISEGKDLLKPNVAGLLSLFKK